MIALETVSKGYGGQTLLTDCSWRIGRGERIGLVPVVHTLDALHASVPDGRYRAIPLLRRIAEEGGSFFGTSG